MKKLTSATFLILSLLFVIHTSSFAQKSGPLKLGIGAFYGFEVETPGLQADATLQVLPRIAIAPGIGVYLGDPEQYRNPFELNLDGHFIVYTNQDYHFYGLAGGNITTFKLENDNDSKTDLGLNIGLGGEYRLDKLSLFSEAKYVIKGFNSVKLSFGARLPLN